MISVENIHKIEFVWAVIDFSYFILYTLDDNISFLFFFNNIFYLICQYF